MSPKSLAHIADETREMRLKMWDLVKGGLSENEALETILTKYQDVEEKPPQEEKHLSLVYWREKGLWPPPEAKQSISDRPDPLELDTMTPIEVWGGAEPLPESIMEEESGLGDGIPNGLMPRIVGLITTTVNAAIMDYHNTQREQLESEIGRLVKEEVAHMTGHIATSHDTEIQGLEPPPRPRTMHGSRKHVVKREKLQGTCDKALFEMFEEDRSKRGYNVSQMIDFVLYNFYKKPQLSFQKDDVD